MMTAENERIRDLGKQVSTCICTVSREWRWPTDVDEYLIQCAQRRGKLADKQWELCQPSSGSGVGIGSGMCRWDLNTGK